MFGPSIALAIGAKFVPLRKPRKLPGMPCYMLNLIEIMILNYNFDYLFNEEVILIILLNIIGFDVAST